MTGTVRQRVEHGMFVREIAPPSPRATLLWIHGLGESGLAFEEVLRSPELGALRHLVPDLPGYGRSLYRDEPPSLEGIADDLARWTAELAPRVVLVGHSMGGVIGLALGERHPDRVERFVNVEGNLSPDDCTYSGWAERHSPEAFLARGFADLLDHVYRLGVEDPAHRGYFASLRHCDPRAFHRNGRELVAISRTEAIAARLARLPFPVTHVAGVPGGNGEHARNLLDRAGVPCVRIEPAGHWPFLDRPRDFAAALQRILEADASERSPT